jgi:hypothetical protein
MDDGICEVCAALKIKEPGYVVFGFSTCEQHIDVSELVRRYENLCARVNALHQ